MSNATEDIVPIADDVHVVRVGDDAARADAPPPVVSPTPRPAAPPVAASTPRRGHGLVVNLAVRVVFALHRAWMALPPDRRGGDGASGDDERRR